MAHQIEGNKAFFTGQPAWHGLGTVLTEAPTIEAAWKLAYPHNLIKLPVQAVCEGETLPIEGHSAIVRDDGKFIGMVGSRYELIQPYESFDFFRPWLESGMIELEAGGSLNDGARMWALGKIKGGEADVAKGDSIKAYVLAATSFDGSMSHVIGDTRTRVVCNNTLAQAMRDDNASMHKLRHTSSLRGAIDAVKMSIEIKLNEFRASVEAYKVLARKPMTAQKMVDYVTQVIVPEDQDVKDLSTKMQTKVLRVVDLLESQRGLELVPAIRGTAWQAYNAVSEYLTHEACRNEDTRLNSQWFGENARLNERALTMALAA